MHADLRDFLDHPQENGRDFRRHHLEDRDSTFSQLNLVSDGTPGSLPALHTDPNLINPWGVSFPPNGPFWISDNGTGVTTVYDGSGTPVTVAGRTAITIAVPPGQTTPSAPTGQVFNGSG